jgi:penicillin amidase
VPHIYAATSDDLFAAQGFVHAQDRLWQLELNRRVGHGQLAELFGPVALSSDRFARIMGFSRVVRQEAATLDDATRAALAAYVRGINSFLEHAGDRLPLEFSILRYRPRTWQIEDVLVWSKIMALNLSENWASEVLRARLVASVGAQRAAELEPRYPATAPTAIPHGALYWPNLGADAAQLAEEAAPFMGGSGFGQGSNAWVVGGNRSASGAPLLANDPHLGITMPSIWYETHLEGGSIHAAGASLPGIPGIIIGHNRRIAWGVTNGMSDVQDLYIERFDPTDRLRYQWRDGWERAELHREEIIVKGRTDPVVEEVRVTRHGPIISPLAESDTKAGAVVAGANEALALRWTALSPTAINRAGMQLMLAEDWDSFRAALADWTVPPQNFVYADVDGHFGYALGGAIPVRVAGHDGKLPVPGWSGTYEWQGFIPNHELPATLDPPQGFVVTANNRIAADDYPHTVAAEWLNGYRAARITALIEATPRHDTTSFARIHRDQYSIPGHALVELAGRLPCSSLLHYDARDALAAWDGVLSADSVGGTIYGTLRYHLQRHAFPELADQLLTPVGLGTFASLPATMFLDRATPDLLRRLVNRDDRWLGSGRTWDAVLADAWAASVADLDARLGPDVRRWIYGRTHQLTLRHALGAVPALRPIFNRGPFPTGGDLDTVCMGHQPRDTAAGPAYVAPSYRHICDPSDWDRSLSIHPTGQSGQPGSSHYSDFAPLWLGTRYHPMLWSRAAVEQATVATLELEPA